MEGEIGHPSAHKSTRLAEGPHLIESGAKGDPLIMRVPKDPDSAGQSFHSCQTAVGHLSMPKR